MAILAECPTCHKKQGARNRQCKCGEDLVKAKKSRRVKYWISFYLPGGKQRRECVGYSIEEARDAEGKRRGQKRENRIFEMLPESKMIISELVEWYLGLQSVQGLKTFDRVEDGVSRFKEMYGSRQLNTIKPLDVENYQEARINKGIASKTVDIELTYLRSMVTKAFDNDIIDGRVVKAFRRVKSRFKAGSNSRDRILTIVEYKNLLHCSVNHLKAILIVAYNTGMRKGELLNLEWKDIDWEKRMIRLPTEKTKETRPKRVPVNHYVESVLRSLPHAIHHDYVFTYRGEPLKRGFVKALQIACRKAGIPYGMNVKHGFRFHDIRTTVKTNMLRAGVDKAHRDIIFGHSLKGMDAYYIKPTDEDLHEAMDKYTEWLYDQLSKTVANSDQTRD